MFFIILPTLGFILSCLLIFCLLQQKHLWHGWDQALLMASVGWYTWLVFTTEALSFFEMLTLYGLVISWLVYIFLLLGIIYYLRDQLYKLHLPHLPPLSLFLKLTLVGIGLIVLVTGLVAFISPPNNSDSMIYHMSRVAHWKQNQAVAYYPTFSITE